ncbi:MAG: flagellar basal body P-ring formation protein FlgA [Robiginitomaculum sp.]|nr:flagellar basal body P-ring formation protein FlgA [Robiginitomaculum sp.]
MAHRIDQAGIRRKFGIIALAVLFLVVSASLVFADNSTDTAKTEPLQLRSNIVVDGETITFGDLFSNSGDLATIAISNAPAPGRKLTLSPLVLSRLATDNARQWSNVTSLRRILVKRAGHRLSNRELSQLIKDEMQANGTNGQYEILISSGAAGIYVPTNGGGFSYIQSVDFNPSNGGFIASLIPYDGANTVTLRGRAWAMKQIPALSRTMSVGEIITADDIKWISTRADRLGVNPIFTEDQLLGKALRRSLRPETPIRLQDVKTPDMVSKGELITITYELPGLRLTARGKVLANAGAGDIVRVVNLSSNRTIEVTITGPGKAVAISTQILGG